MHQTEPDWLDFVQVNEIERLIWTGKNYHSFLLNSTLNPFWKSVILAYNNLSWLANKALTIPMPSQPI